MHQSYFDFLLFTFAGLVGAPHCIGMCGGIMSTWALNSSISVLHTVLAYNLGRITTYTILGGFMGFAGSFVEGAGKIVGLQGMASILGGIFILLWTIKKYALPFAHWTPVKFPFIKKFLTQNKPRSETTYMFTNGVLLGFLPCGLSYTIQMQAAGSGAPWNGALIMALFGLGTLPALLFMGVFTNFAKQSFRSKIQIFSNVIAVTIGILSIMRGMVVNGWVTSINPWLW